MRKKEEKVLRVRESVRVLIIQPMAMRSSLHSLPSLKCEEGKQYHENMQFYHSIIQDMYRSFVIEFLRRQRRGLEFKGARKFKSNTNGSSIDPRVK